MARLPKQTFENLVGTWTLAGVSHERGDVAMEYYALSAAIVVQLQHGSRSVTGLDAATGLTLTVSPDRTFEEEGEADVTWFSVDGVLLDHAEPFSGTMHGWYLLTDGAPAPPSEGPALRVDDGDTKISDRLDWHPAKRSGEGAGPERILRTMNVVTDEMYLDRLILEYHRA